MTEPKTTTAEQLKVSSIHVGDTETGIIMGFTDGSFAHWPMTEECYKEQWAKAEIKLDILGPHPKGETGQVSVKADSISLDDATSQPTGPAGEAMTPNEYMLSVIEQAMRRRAIVYARAEGEDFRTVDFANAAKGLLATLREALPNADGPQVPREPLPTQPSKSTVDDQIEDLWHKCGVEGKDGQWYCNEGKLFAGIRQLVAEQTTKARIEGAEALFKLNSGDTPTGE